MIVDVQDGNHGEAHPKTDDFVSEEIPFVMAKDLVNGQINLADCHKITWHQYQSLRVGFARPSDVLLSHKGTIGLTAIVPDWLQHVMLTPQVTYYRVSEGKKLSGKFLFWFFQSPLFQQRLEVLSAQSTRSYIGITLQKTLSIVVPPFDEQKRIAELLDTVDEAIAHTSSLIAKLKQMKAGLLHDLLTRGLDENGELRDAIAHPEQFKDSPLGRIPKDWEVAPLKAKQNPGFPYIKTGPFGSTLKGEHWVEEGTPVITIGSIGEGEFIESELLFISEAKARSLSAYAVKEGDLVFSRVADVGRSVVVSAAEDGWIMSSNLMRISLDRALVSPTFGYLNIVHNELTRQQIRKFVNSGGREIANTAILDSLQFCWASREEQNSIAQAASIYDTRIRAEEAYREKLKLQKQGLMHDLLTGQVRVTSVKPVKENTSQLAALITASPNAYSHLSHHSYQ